MKKIFLALFALLSLTASAREWSLRVDDSGRFLQYADGTPFFWLGETGWLLPECLNREEALVYLDACEKAGYNVVQVQTINAVPATNAYGATSDTEGYWQHMDYIISAAEERGIYIGMVCVWGGLVKGGKMNVEEARAYGRMLAERYKNSPNIVWIIGGDIYGDVKREVWEALATTIKSIDPNHLMTFHPFGRHISSIWFHDAQWLDFNMFQSGHRCYGQSVAKKNPERPDLLPDSTEEDNWRYVALARACEPAKPVLDGEPSYEGIPYGLHDFSLPKWQDYDVRRYAYWSVFAGSFGHTYGNNAIMQMHKSHRVGAYGSRKTWQEGLKDPGFSQMQYLSRLILAFSDPDDSADKSAHPYFCRRPDKDLIVGQNGERYDRLLACRGEDYLLVYDYNAVPFTVDLSRISGQRKRAWWYHATDGWLEEIGLLAAGEQTRRFSYVAQGPHDDRVLIVTDEAAGYVKHLQQAPAFSVTDARCEQRSNPEGLSVAQPRLSWKIATHARDVRQTAYRILVASSEEKLSAGEADVWDSGRVGSDESVLVPYGGPRLKPSTYYYWKVQVWTRLSAEPQESAPQHWLTALFTDKDWKPSQWIGYDGAFPWEDESLHPRLGARYLRHEFRADRDIRRAVLHIAGLGLYELHVNGQRIGEDVLTPGPTDYRQRILYQTYDVTEQLQKGDNALGVILGNGRAYPMRPFYKPYKWTFFSYPKMRLLLTIEYADGRTQRVVTGSGWSLTARGPIVSNNEYDGEEYDARLELGDWTRPGYRASDDWMPAKLTCVPAAAMQAQLNPGMKVLRTLAPKSINQLNDSTFILDMGENMTGWVRLKVHGPSGQTVKLRFAEALLPDGRLSMANLRDALVTDKYTLKGDPQGEEWAPRFVTHGFQYVEVTGFPGTPRKENFVGEFVADGLEETGRFESGHPVFDATYANAWRGILGNYKGVPVDCPQRNERQPWLGDRTMGCYGESYLFDVANFYAKWADDIADAQRWDGAIPDVAPAYWNYYKDDVTWPAAFFNVCDMVYRRYGDLRPMESHFDAMLKYLQYTYDNYFDAKTGLIVSDSYGDWCMPVESPEIIHSQAPDRLTDGKYIATVYFRALYQLMVAYAPLLGRQADVQEFPGRIEAFARALNDNFYHPDPRSYSNNTATANLLALAYDLVPEADREAVKAHIRSKIMDEYKGTMATGIIGNQWLWRVLSREGMSDVAWRLITTTDYPSFGYMVSQGATTIWELWNGDTANPSMNSRNHVMQLGDLLVWCYECLAGIRCDAEHVAFKKLHMAPDFRMEACDGVKASYETPYGTVRSQWSRRADGSLEWNITVPANTTAEIVVPAADKKKLTADGQPAAKAGLKWLGAAADGAHWNVPSGVYSLTVLP